MAKTACVQSFETKIILKQNKKEECCHLMMSRPRFMEIKQGTSTKMQLELSSADPWNAQSK
jgi:hypothetical protein